MVSTFLLVMKRGWSIGLAGPSSGSQLGSPPRRRLQALDEVLPLWDARCGSDTLCQFPGPLDAALPRAQPLGVRGTATTKLPLRGAGTCVLSSPPTFSNEVRFAVTLFPLLEWRSGIRCGPEALYFLKWNLSPNSPCLTQLFRDTLRGSMNPSNQVTLSEMRLGIAMVNRSGV